MIIIPFDKMRKAFISDVKVLNPSNNTYVQIEALWDTGATSSTVPNIIIQKLNAKCISTTEVKGSTGNIYCSTFNLIFLIDGKINNVFVNNNNLQFSLIGMDIISKGKMYIDNVNGNLTMYFEFV